MIDTSNRDVLKPLQLKIIDSEFSTVLRQYISGALIGATALLSGCNNSKVDNSLEEGNARIALSQNSSNNTDPESTTELNNEKHPDLIAQSAVKDNPLNEVETPIKEYPEKRTIEAFADVPGENTEQGIIINSKYVLVPFNYRNAVQCRVYMDSAFASVVGNTGAALTAEKFHGQTFYVAPHAGLDQKMLSDAFSKKTKAGNVLGQDTYEMKISIDILPDELRNAASQAINSKFDLASGTVKPTDIAVVPYSYIEGVMIVDGKEKVIGSWPTLKPSGKAFENPSSHPTSFILPVYGTAEGLQGIVETGTFKWRYFLSGFTFTRNEIGMAVSHMVQSGLMNSINGTGGANDSLNQNVNSNSVGGNFFGLFGGHQGSTGTNVSRNISTFVTRDQVKNLTEDYLKSAIINGWYEFDGGRDQINAFADRIVDVMLDRFEKIDLQIDENQKVIITEDFAKDIEPSKIEELKSELDSKIHDSFSRKQTQEKFQKEKKVESKNDDLEAKFDKDYNIKYETKGARIVPSNITIYEVKQNSFRGLENIRITHSESKMAGADYSEPGYVYQTDTEAMQLSTPQRINHKFRFQGADYFEQTTPNADNELDYDQIEWTVDSNPAFIDTTTNEIKIPIKFTAYEVEADNTKMEMSSVIVVPAPPEKRFAAIASGNQPVSINFKTQGKCLYDGIPFFREPPLSLTTTMISGQAIQLPNGVFGRIDVRSDGPESEDQHHCQIDGVIAVDVQYHEKDATTTVRRLR